jgi:hypothetical protein
MLPVGTNKRLRSGRPYPRYRTNSPLPGEQPGRRDLGDAYIKQLVDNAPPLTDRQRDVLALLFGGHRSAAGRLCP